MTMQSTEFKRVNIELSRELAHEAIDAEHAKDYAFAEKKWLQALAVCRDSSETLCRNRSETCRALLNLSGGQLISALSVENNGLLRG